ncbi:MAG: signal peptidase I, partial [Cyanobacteriota bacterium]|nr:signal peptidase I [Cyanobacteriota bacterium]
MVGTVCAGPAAVAETNPQPSRWREAWSVARGILPWLLVALLLRWLVVEPRWIPSGSMLPTLQLEDRVLVQKLLPRLGVPPGIGAIVVFRPPQTLLEMGYDARAALIKRVVAVAGDQVEVREGRLWRNGEAVD